MAHTITILKQGKISNVGLITHGVITPTGTYTTGGEDATASLQAKLNGFTEIDAVHFAFDDGYTAFWDKTTEKIRIFKLAAGVMTERANAAAYDADVAIPFTCYSH